MGNSDDDSDFAEYGTALEAIEEDDASRKRPITVAEQIAVDEKGRRRFHGAFTGGFSAGYFNTVGSKEGWAPSTFKSSRSDRGSFKSQNVLDFMDEEDKGAFGIAPQVLRPTDDFSDKNDSRGQKRARSDRSDGPIPGVPVLDQIIQPVKETVGIKILVKMGWRPGKGLGPKIDRKDRSKSKRPKISSEKASLFSSSSHAEDLEESAETDQTAGKVYGCSIPAEFMHAGDSEHSSDDEIEEAKALLAPDDVNALLCNPKENSFGLGYRGLDRNALQPTGSQVDLFGTKLKFRVENKNLSISGQAFGVGAFEENDDDIYSKEDMSQYDFALETPEERKRRKAKEHQDKRKSKNKENCIEGFNMSVSTSKGLKRRNFPPPPLPPNFQPFHTIKKSRFEGTKSTDENQEDAAKSKGLARHSLTISERQVLIEEDTSLIPPVGTVADNEKIASTEVENVKTKSSLPVVAKPSVQPDNDIQHRIERLKKFTQVLQAYSSKTPEENAKAAFKPFMKNPEKQERYEKYLTLRDAGYSECLKDLQPADMTEWEREREKMEFERASKLYKPMNSILASRFVSAKSHDISHLEPEKESVKEKSPKDDPKVAARMKLFGNLTHRIMEWHPDKLVSKRFNVPHPYPDSKFVGVKGDPSAWNKDASFNMANTAVASNKLVEIPKKKNLFDNLDFTKPPPGLLPQEALQQAASSSTASPRESAGGAETASGALPMLAFQREITSTNTTSNAEDSEMVEKPPLDLFKEIFADSSDSENEEIEEIEVPIRPGTSQEKENRSQHFISQLVRREKVADDERDDKPLDKMVSSNNDGKSLPLENESVNQGKETRRRGVFDKIDLDRLQYHSHHRAAENKSPSPSRNSGSGDEDTYGPAPPKSATFYQVTSRENQSGSSSNLSNTRSTTAASGSVYRTHKSVFDDRKKEVNTEEVMWIEKSALSDGSSSSKSHVKTKKHSSKKKSRRKSDKKEKRKKHKSKGHKHKKQKGHKHKKSSKSKRDTSDDESGSKRGSNDDDGSTSDASSSDSVTINDSLDNRALLAKLKQITRSN